MWRNLLFARAEDRQALALDRRLAAAREGVARVGLHPHARHVLVILPVLWQPALCRDQLRFLPQRLRRPDDHATTQSDPPVPARRVFLVLAEGDALADQLLGREFLRWRHFCPSSTSRTTRNPLPRRMSGASPSRAAERHAAG